MRLDQYLQELEERETDLEMDRLFDGKPDTTTAARFWASIADGSASVDETLVWAKIVAEKIVADVVNGTERDAAPAALKAIGFYGPAVHVGAAREYLDIAASFDVIDEHGESRPSPRRPASEWLKELRSHGHLLDVADKTAINLINSWRKKRPAIE